MNDSSSFHKLNADRGLRSWRKVAYLGANVIGNLLPNIGGDRRLRVQRWRPNVGREEWFSIDAGASMARKWSNLFWMRLPWHELATKVGSLNILDMGCGQGGYGPRFVGWGGSAVSSYLGVEPSAKHTERWKGLMDNDPRLSYVNGSAGDIGRFLEGSVNMFVTQSSLEHIDNDVLLFRRVADSLREHPRPFVQVHLVPAAASLPLYVFHGIRQYTPRTLSQISGLFPASSVSLYGLGGWASWLLHWRAMTWPVFILRKSQLHNQPKYPERTWQAFQTDVGRQWGPPLFYALVIRSGLSAE